MKRRASVPRACKRVHTNPVEAKLELLDLPNEILVMILQLAVVLPTAEPEPEWSVADRVVRNLMYRAAIELARTCHRFQDLFVNYTCTAVRLQPARMAEDFFARNGIKQNATDLRPHKSTIETKRKILCECALWELRFIRTVRASVGAVFLPPRVMAEKFGDSYYSASIVFRDPKRPALAFVWPTEMANAFAQTHYSDRKPPIELEPRMSVQLMEICRARHQASN